jgi:hypothetical protein
MIKVIKLKIILIFILIGCITLVGCNNKELENLTSQYNEAQEENILLKDKIVRLENQNIKLKETINLNKIISRKEYFNLIMSRFAAMARLLHEDIESLENTYSIISNHTIEEEWYILREKSFEIELLGYESAEEVTFYYTKLETDMGPRLLFHDINSNNGWIYKTDNINEIFDSSKESNTNWPATYILYAEVKLSDGKIKQTAVMPIYYITD